MPQRVSTRGPAPLRTSSSESDPSHHRPMTDRSPKLGDRRSPRNAQSEPLNQKKLGTRIAGLETQLEQAQGELKILKDQLASAEAAKKEAQKELEKRTTHTKPAVSEPEPVQDFRSSPSETTHDSNKEMSQDHENPDEIQKETDVFEVPVEMVSLKSPMAESPAKPMNMSPESPQKLHFQEAMAAKNEEITSLKSKLEAKEHGLVELGQENQNLKHQLREANVQISSGKAKEEKTNLKLTHLEEELKKSKKDGNELNKKLKEVEGAKEALETEMKKLRVQTEQWRKAADAAAAILAGGVEMNDGRRVSERCGSMDKHYGGVYDGYGGFVGSPGGGLGDECEDGKRKGIRMFGDLWKKKGQK